MYYKVVSVLNGSLISARVWVHAAGYKIGEWATPPIEGSKLFVFDSLGAAARFRLPNEKIFECEVENPIKPTGLPEWLSTFLPFGERRQSN